MHEIKRRVIIIHGTCGHPGENWFPWLAGKLQNRGVDTIIPKFPTPDGQSLESWRATFASAAGDLRARDILIGHSVGCAFALRLLERSAIPVRAAFLAAPFAGELGNPEFDPLIRSFVCDPWDWPKIKANCGEFTAYVGDDDPYVPLNLSQEVVWNLGATLIMLPGGGHLSAAAGYLEFEELYEDLKRLIDQ